MFRVRVFRQDDLIQELKLEDAPCRIGRHPESEILLDDKIVSRRHARFIRESDTWQVEDLGSTNGTYLAGGRITRMPLRGGEEITIGPFRLMIESIQPGGDATVVAPPDIPEHTEGRAAISAPGGDLLTGEPGCVIIGPDGSRHFHPLPPGTFARVPVPQIPAEIFRKNGEPVIKLPGEGGQIELPLTAELQQFPSGFAGRFLHPDEMLITGSLAPSGTPERSLPLRGLREKLTPQMLLIPVLAGVLIYLIFSPAPSGKQPGELPRSPAETSQPPHLPEEVSPPPPDPDPARETIFEQTVLPAEETSVPAVKTPSRTSLPSPARRPEIVLPSESLEPSPQESLPPSSDPLLDRGFVRYLRGNLGSAREEWIALAESLPVSDPNRSRSRNLAQKVGILRDELILGYEAEKKEAYPTARDHWETARKLDWEIFPRGEGQIHDEIRDNLARVLTREGEAAFRSGDYPRSFRCFREILTLRPESEPARQGLARLETFALSLYREAYLMENANQEEAREKYRLITRILPPDHDYYKKALRRLQ